MLLVVVHVAGGLHVFHEGAGPDVVGVGVKDLPEALLGLVDLAPVLVEDGQVEQRVHVRPVVRTDLLIPHQVQEVGELEMVLGVVVPLDRLAQLVDGTRPIARGFQLEGSGVVGIGGGGVGRRFAYADHRVENVLTHGSLRVRARKASKRDGERAPGSA